VIIKILGKKQTKLSKKWNTILNNIQGF
jgi:hypothetical protein